MAFVGRIWLVTDCCGLVCAFITWLLGKFFFLAQNSVAIITILNRFNTWFFSISI